MIVTDKYGAASWKAVCTRCSAEVWECKSADEAEKSLRHMSTCSVPVEENASKSREKVLIDEAVQEMATALTVRLKRIFKGDSWKDPTKSAVLTIPRKPFTNLLKKVLQK